jgi:hypothetical protein
MYFFMDYQKILKLYKNLKYNQSIDVFFLLFFEWFNKISN